MTDQRHQFSAKAASFGLSLSLAAAICIGCQTRQWSWGFALLFLGLALVAAIPALLRNRLHLPLWTVIISLVTAGWFAWRAWMSPVRELATSDFLLLLLASGGGAIASIIFAKRRSAAIFLWSLCLLIAAGFVVCLIQSRDPSFAPILRSRPYDFPSGFFGHYNECANFFIGGSLLLGGFAVAGPFPKWQRIVWGLVAASGVAGIYLSHSRGGLLAVSGGLVLGVILLLILGRRSRWFGAAVVAVPLVLIVTGIFLLKGWETAQQARGVDDTATAGLVDGVLGNPIRLSLLEIAAKAVTLAPWAGSGSGSFRWNVYQLWDDSDHGGMQTRPEVVHNELMQSATDYGILGAGLVLVLFSTLVISGGVRLLTSKDQSGLHIPAILGGIAALTGMFLQSCSSPVFHLPPGALLLGITLGALVPARKREPGDEMKVARFLPVAPLVAASAVALWTSVPRSQMTVVLWNVFFKGKPAPSQWEIARRLDESTQILPLPSTLSELGTLLFRIARSDNELAAEAEEKAIAAYTASIAANPKNPTTALNLANLLSNVGRDEEAEKEYRRTIELQGKVEGLFKGHFRLAEHFLRRGIRHLGNRETELSIQDLEAALEEISASESLAHWLIHGSYDGAKLVDDVNENLGLALEANGDFEGALQCYETAAKIQPKSHYHIGRLMETMARTHWSERRPSQALRTFQQAVGHLRQTNDFPAGVTAQDAAKRIEAIEGMIRFLTEAGIQPAAR